MGDDRPVRVDKNARVWYTAPICAQTGYALFYTESRSKVTRDMACLHTSEVFEWQRIIIVMTRPNGTPRPGVDAGRRERIMLESSHEKNVPQWPQCSFGSSRFWGPCS